MAPGGGGQGMGVCCHVKRVRYYVILLLFLLSNNNINFFFMLSRVSRYVYIGGEIRP